MDTFQQPKITGYRQLSEAEVMLMNRGKELAEEVGAWIAALRSLPMTMSDPEGRPLPGSDREGRPFIDQRWVSIGATQLQQGFMAVTRGIAQPTTF